MHTPHHQATLALAFVFLGGIALVTGCGGSPTAPTTTTSPQGTGSAASSGNLDGVVSANHPMPHIAIITAAQLSAGIAITLSISNGFHTHTVSFTDAEMRQIAAKVTVSANSSESPHSDGSDPHRHQVTFN